MSKVVYWMSVSLDGFVETRDGNIDWTAPNEELHRFFNESAQNVGAFLYGRRSYELMSSFWPTADQDPSAPEAIAEFARIWRRTPKVVFSKTLKTVAHDARLAGA
jgi:dihydrofolate reductase